LLLLSAKGRRLFRHKCIAYFLLHYIFAGWIAAGCRLFAFTLDYTTLATDFDFASPVITFSSPFSPLFISQARWPHSQAIYFAADYAFIFARSFRLADFCRQLRPPRW